MKGLRRALIFFESMDFSVSLNLSKLKNVGITDLQGSTSVKRCVVIPIEDNHLYVSDKGVMLNLSAWESKQVGKYGDTHYVKQRLPKEYRDAHPDEMKQTPIIGNMKPIGGVAPQQPTAMYTDSGITNDPIF